ncbi:MAG: hypothetical protein RI988_3303 [Pseudomonadota bacterium]|jgi:enoyl-CoA hydratase/carnithine racemase
MVSTPLPPGSVVDGVLEQAHGDVVVLTLHAPERRNALSPELRLRLRDRLQAALDSPDVRAIVLTGAQGMFSAGGDVRQMAERPAPALARQRLQVLHDIVRGIVGGPKPVIAAVEGVAFGAGFSLVAACDHVIAGEGASFCAVFGRIGLVADCGLLWTLPQRVGWSATRDLLLTARVVDTAEAARLGLVDRVVPAGSALQAALAQAAAYGTVGPLALAATKSALARRPASLEEALAMEADLQASLRVSEDHRDACEAFLAKRRVTMHGR